MVLFTRSFFTPEERRNPIITRCDAFKRLLYVTADYNYLIDKIILEPHIQLPIFNFDFFLCTNFSYMIIVLS